LACKLIPLMKDAGPRPATHLFSVSEASNYSWASMVFSFSLKLRLRNVVAGGCSGCYSIADNIALKRTKAPVEHKVDGTGVYAPRLRRDWEICLPSAVRHASS